MTPAFEKCPYCDATFRGESSPRCAGENAFLKARTHVWMRHPEKLFRCPAYHVSTEAINDFWREDGKCSYCGSITAEAFFSSVYSGELLTPTDKDYKVYLDGLNKEFKFAHMNEEQMKQFVDLYNLGKLNMPNRFYVLPFFMRDGHAA